MKSGLDIGNLHRTLPSQDALFALMAFEKEGDIVRAAQSLQVTQPAISFHLKKLEESLGFQLFSTSGKRKVLTKLGQAYVEEIKAVFLGFHLSQERISKQVQDLDHQKLRLAGRRELFIPFLSFPFPGQIELIQSTSLEALLALREHRVDLAVSAQTVDSGDLVAKLFFESNLKLVTPKKWKFNSKNEDELKNMPVIVYGNHHAYLDDYLKGRDWKFGDLTVSRVVEDWFSVVELVKFGYGWAIIPEAWGIHTDQVQVHSLNANSVPKQKIFLFHRRDDRKTPWVSKLEEWLKDVRE
jgi:DNA-binding transcriptional LysR family regulator